MAIANTTPTVGGTSGLSSKHQNCINKQVFEYDLTTFTGASADQQYLIALPAYTSIAYLQVIVKTACTGVTRLDLGDNGSATRFISNAATFTAGLVLTQAITTMPLITYTTADKLLLKITTAPTAGVLRFVVGLIDCGADSPMTVQA